MEDTKIMTITDENGQEKEVTLPIVYSKNYEVGQWVTLYLNPDNGEIYAYPDTHK